MKDMPLSHLRGVTIYLIGPMSGYKDHNRPAFRKATEVLRRHDLNVVSPDELDEVDPLHTEDGKEPSWEEYLARDLPWVCRAEVGVALPGWRDSRGARLETTVLGQLGRDVWDLNIKDRTITRVEKYSLPVPVFKI